MPEKESLRFLDYSIIVWSTAARQVISHSYELYKTLLTAKGHYHSSLHSRSICRWAFCSSYKRTFIPSAEYLARKLYPIFSYSYLVIHDTLLPTMNFS